MGERVDRQIGKQIDRQSQTFNSRLIYQVIPLFLSEFWIIKTRDQNLHFIEIWPSIPWVSMTSFYYLQGVQRVFKVFFRTTTLRLHNKITSLQYWQETFWIEFTSFFIPQKNFSVSKINLKCLVRSLHILGEVYPTECKLLNKWDSEKVGWENKVDEEFPPPQPF